jgi:hypothetical protein
MKRLKYSEKEKSLRDHLIYKRLIRKRDQLPIILHWKSPRFSKGRRVQLRRLRETIRRVFWKILRRIACWLRSTKVPRE